jgi:hypothetical protein
LQSQRRERARSELISSDSTRGQLHNWPMKRNREVAADCKEIRKFRQVEQRPQKAVIAAIAMSLKRPALSLRACLT